MEIFKPVEGYEGLYEVSNYGRVKSLQRWVSRIRDGKEYKQFVKECIRVCSKQNTGYLTIRLAKDGIVKTFRVHRLVAKSFLDNPHGKQTVNHIDGNKHNNHIDNLEWCTMSEQQKHAIEIGLFGLINDPVNGRFTAKGVKNGTEN